ncbi:MAG: bifunctional [glutamine synthetase] adenylyltransferase/[glutamine synthetase]-adenylyl-L-tyrosine phosphorylase, partial [Actinocatenispora sp.]
MSAQHPQGAAPTPRRPVARLSRYGLADTRRAAELLGVDAGLVWWDPTRMAPVDEESATLLSALAGTADPDLALLQLHRFAAAQHDSAGDEDLAGTGLLRAMRSEPGLADRLLSVLGASAALGDHLVACPDDWRVLTDARFPYGRRDVASLSDELRTAVRGATGPEAVSALRLAYRRVLLCVAAADLTGLRGVEEVMAELADLADATLRAALSIAEAEQPAGAEPFRLSVIAMGKTGGDELNYVSDVDVLFVAEPAATGGPSATGAPMEATDPDAALRAATGVAARLMDVCRQVAWPVDAGLRPEGRDGPLVRTVASYHAYYVRWAKTWEFQALLKARPAAGDAALGEEWLDSVRPLIWQTADGAERPSMVAEIRAMRRRVEDQLPAGEAEREIKLGRGGLRDIEFAVQLLQLVHGRSDETLRSPSTLTALRALTDGGYVGRSDGEELDSAYQFLRAIEHRLQLQQLRRTHRIPDDEAGLRWLAQALGYRPDGDRSAVRGFLRDWSTLARNVRRLHEKLLYRPLLAAVAKVPTDALRLTSGQAESRLAALGFADPAGALRH